MGMAWNDPIQTCKFSQWLNLYIRSCQDQIGNFLQEKIWRICRELLKCDSSVIILIGWSGSTDAFTV